MLLKLAVSFWYRLSCNFWDGNVYEIVDELKYRTGAESDSEETTAPEINVKWFQHKLVTTGLLKNNHSENKLFDIRL